MSSDIAIHSHSWCCYCFRAQTEDIQRMLQDVAPEIPNTAHRIECLSKGPYLFLPCSRPGQVRWQYFSPCGLPAPTGWPRTSVGVQSAGRWAGRHSGASVAQEESSLPSVVVRDGAPRLVQPPHGGPARPAGGRLAGHVLNLADYSDLLQLCLHSEGLGTQVSMAIIIKLYWDFLIYFLST